MIRTLLVILLVLPLLSVAPVPVDRTAPQGGWAQITVVIHAPARTQACTWEIAPARLQQEIEDPIGYPFGFVQAFSCDGDSAAVIAELQTRAAAMQAAARAYRAAHPIGGVQ